MKHKLLQSPVAILAVVTAGVMAVTAVTVVMTNSPVRSGMDVDARSDGAGTFPDGVADELREGLGNETSTDDFIDNSAASDGVSPLLEVEDAAPPPETDATNLEDAPDHMLKDVD